jgi:hypothetical protein
MFFVAAFPRGPKHSQKSAVAASAGWEVSFVGAASLGGEASTDFSGKIPSTGGSDGFGAATGCSTWACTGKKLLPSKTLSTQTNKDFIPYMVLPPQKRAEQNRSKLSRRYVADESWSNPFRGSQQTLLLSAASALSAVNSLGGFFGFAL